MGDITLGHLESKCSEQNEWFAARSRKLSLTPSLWKELLVFPLAKFFLQVPVSPGADLSLANLELQKDLFFILCAIGRLGLTALSRSKFCFGKTVT